MEKLCGRAPEGHIWNRWLISEQEVMTFEQVEFVAVVWITKNGRTLEAALSELREMADFLLNSPNIWRKR